MVGSTCIHWGRTTLFQEEMMEFIEETFGVEVSISTISRTLQREKISRKKVYILAPNWWTKSSFNELQEREVSL